MEKMKKETWEEETLRLLNEGELGEALKMFRQKHKMFNRFVCDKCGNVQHTMSVSQGCDKCSNASLPIKIIVEEPTTKSMISKIAWWLFQIATITYFMIAAIGINSEKREKIGYLKGRISMYKEIMEYVEAKQEETE